MRSFKVSDEVRFPLIPLPRKEATLGKAPVSEKSSEFPLIPLPRKEAT